MFYPFLYVIEDSQAVTAFIQNISKFPSSFSPLTSAKKKNPNTSCVISYSHCKKFSGAIKESCVMECNKGAVVESGLHLLPHHHSMFPIVIVSIQYPKPPTRMPEVSRDPDSSDVAPG